ncbi:c-type cytochrome [Sphingomonas adhaesiva]|uniref:c-type cytochrome n=1 Tax=Sphingomonas adhaesiva TaxID=28212 RepID=UPI002FFB3A58
MTGLAAASLSVLAGTASAQQADGGTIFRQRCQMCHVSTPGQRAGLGPNLAGVGGRKAASTDFLYSPALRASGLKWDKPTLDKFLQAPGKMVPGTRMAISVANPADRAALVNYLVSLRK